MYGKKNSKTKYRSKFCVVRLYKNCIGGNYVCIRKRTENR